MKIRPATMVPFLFLAGVLLLPRAARTQETPPADPAEQASRLLQAHGDDLFAGDGNEAPDPAILKTGRPAEAYSGT